MWLLFTASVAVSIVFTDWLSGTPLYRQLPLISGLEGMGGFGPTAAGALAFIIVLALLYMLFWTVGNAINFLSPGSFRDFTERLGKAQGAEPGMRAVCVFVPLL